MLCSDEQKEIVDAISCNNVIVDACAGSGKTTTVLNIAKTYASDSILLLTYNARLRAETNTRASNLGLENLTVHTYHSFGYKYISKNCRTDKGIIEFINSGRDLTQCCSSEGSDLTQSDLTQSDLTDDCSFCIDNAECNFDNVFDDALDSTINTINTINTTVQSESLSALTNNALPRYDIVIIDEAQDMNQYYYKLARSILSLNPAARICVMGDRCQSVYNFNGADQRFITLADLLFECSTVPNTNVLHPTILHPTGQNTKNRWVRKNLSTSYRMTTQMAALINNCICRGEASTPIETVREGHLPVYTFYTSSKVIVADIKELFRAGYSPGDIFILAPSVKSTNSKNPIKCLANDLSASGILVYVPNSDDARVDDDIIAGKLVFSSFHQAKGLERKVVMIIGFDCSYNLYYEKTNPEKVSNALYVAITRARERLYLYHYKTSEYLQCVDSEKISRYVKTVGTYNGKTAKKDEPSRIVAVTRLLTHVRSDILQWCMDQIVIDTIRTAEEILPIIYKSEQCIVQKPNREHTYYYEDVSDINGIAIPMYYEMRKSVDSADFSEDFSKDRTDPADFSEGKDSTDLTILSKITIISELLRGMDKGEITIPGYNAEKIYTLAKSLLHGRMTFSDYTTDDSTISPIVLELSNVYSAARSGLNHKLNQINCYNWISDYFLESARVRTSNTLGGDGEKMEVRTEIEVGGMTIVGYADYIDDERLIEIKCTGELKPEHYLQLAIYSLSVKRKKNQLFNIITNELHQITVAHESVIAMLKLIICSKYHQCDGLTNAEFLQSLGVVRGEIPHLCPNCLIVI